MQFLAFDLQLVSSGVYFGAAGLLIFAAAVLACRKVHASSSCNRRPGLPDSLW
jgi:hypothetical protein